MHAFKFDFHSKSKNWSSGAVEDPSVQGSEMIDPALHKTVYGFQVSGFSDGNRTWQFLHVYSRDAGNAKAILVFCRPPND